MTHPLRLVALYGTGDAYLVCALARQVEMHHGRAVTVIVKPAHAAIPRLFGIPYAVDEVLVRRAESDGQMHRLYENDIGRVLHYYVHPHFLRSGVRVDRLTVKPSVSQADMYRALLHLPPAAPLALPSAPIAVTVPDTVLLIPEARSWPNTQAQFWPELSAALMAIGRAVTWNDPRWTLDELLQRCAESEWVIGPQCGVMSILCHARFPCRKTFATPSVDGGRYPGLPVADTFPYALVTKFAGEDYDVEQFKITADNHAALIDRIAGGPNAERVAPLRTDPLPTRDDLDRLLEIA